MTLPSSGPLTFSDIQTEFGGSNPIGLNEYYAGGGLVPSGTTGTYGAVPTSGQISVQNFYGTSNYIPVYIEELFSTYLYTGNGSTQTITNAINLSGKGGLVWVKERNNSYGHVFVDTSRGINQVLRSNDTAAQTTYGSTVSAFNSNGFSLGSSAQVNDSFGGYELYASWTFRKQPKFFDVVTYTGASPSSVTVNHNLGSVPGCIIIKCINDAASWAVYHRSTGIGKILYLNGTQAASTDTTFVTAVTSSSFTVGDNAFTNNSPAKTYVAYLFAHDAGGFGLTGSDNIISCGSYTGGGGGSNTTVTLGYEPQWVLIKRTDITEDWNIGDNMRGSVANATKGPFLWANSSSPEGSYASAEFTATATGFQLPGSNSGFNAFGGTYIYIAIRRGPMKVPTSGTSVFSPVARTGTGSAGNIITTPGFAPDALLSSRTLNLGGYYVFGTIDKLRGRYGLEMTATDYENAFTPNADLIEWSNVGYKLGPSSGANINNLNINYIDWVMQRAPKFFDVVCYTGNGVQTARNHNLGVVPEFIIAKRRNFPGGDWGMYIEFGVSTYRASALPYTVGFTTLSYGTGVTFGAAPTATTFTTSQDAGFNGSGYNYVAYLFASCPGVSKVGTYTGTGALQTINCGFTGGARFILIKRTDSTGDWYVYDSARGISSGTDPYVFLNSRNIEVTGTNYVDTTSVGFQVTAAAPADLNASGGTYLFLAIA